jgi:phage tail tape-measure protein
LGIRAYQESGRLKKGEIDAEEFRARTASHFGSISGGAAGATVGAAAGSVIPVVGTIIGGFVGGMIGEAGGSRFFRMAASELESRRKGEEAPQGPPPRQL